MKINKNELTNAPSPVGNQIYDLNGNMRTNHGGNWVYQYDYENRLIEFYRFDQFPNKLTQFFYDGLGRLRVRDEFHWEDPPGESPLGIEPDLVTPPGGGSWVLDSETRYIYDGWRVIQERVLPCRRSRNAQE